MRLRNHHAAFLAALVTSCAAVTALPAQAPLVPLRGVAYDSVRGRPLGGAFVTLDGGRSTESDARGHFQFDSVSIGEHVVSMQHVALDSLGFSGLSLRARVTEASGELRIATPSFASMWGVACRSKTPPKDSGFVYGTVIDAQTRKPLAKALVGVTWLALDVKKGRDVNMQQFAGAAQTNADGGYAICGVPVGLGLRMQASADSVDSGLIELLVTDLPVQRRDFSISRTATARGGVIVGRVTGPDNAPVANARVLIDSDTLERRTDERGALVIRDVPPGSRQVEAFAIGMSPRAQILDVAPGDTARFGVTLDRVQTLDVIRVRSSAGGRRRALEVYERQRIGLGYFRDSTEIGRYAALSSSFDQLPSTMVQRTGTSQFTVFMKTPTGAWCRAQLFVDGVATDQDWLASYSPADIAVIEAYPRGASVPASFTSRGVLTGNCGAAIIWTKSGFK